MQRFELIEGKSSKFWEVEIQGATLAVRFGRIGTNGQSQTKEFADTAAVEKERDKLIREKTGKGYKETTIDAGAALAAVPPKEADDTARKPAPAAAETVLVESSPGKPLAPQALPWPTGGFQGHRKEDNPRFVAVCGEIALPVVRGFHCPPFPTQLSPIDNLPVFDEDKNGYYERDLQTLALGCQRSWKYWKEAGSRQQLTRDKLTAGDPEWWMEATAQCLVNGNYRGNAGQWIVQIGIAQHGTVFMLDILLKLFRAFPDYKAFPAVLVILRHAVAAAGEAEYAAAFALADAASDESIMPALAHLFPHHAPWVDKALSLPKEDGQRLLVDCVMSVEQMIGYWRKFGYFAYYGRSGILLQLALHGGDAMPLLADMLARAKDKSEIERALAWIEALPCPAQVLVLAKHMEDAEEIRAALDRVAETFPAATLYAAIGEWHRRPSRRLQVWTLRLATRQDAALAQALSALPTAPAAAWRAVMAALNPEEAPADALPDLLRAPPWTRKLRPQALPTLEISRLSTPPVITWQAGEEARYKQYSPRGNGSMRLGHTLNDHQEHPLVKRYAGDDARLRDLALLLFYRFKDEVLEAILAGRPVQAGDLVDKPGERRPEFLVAVSPAFRLNVWNGFPAEIWEHYGEYRSVAQWMLAEHGPNALPGFIAFAHLHIIDGLAAAPSVDAPELASLALHALRNLKKASDAAQRWILAHPRTTAIVALNEAFAKDKASRDNGALGLRWLMRQGREAMIDSLAAEYDAATGIDVSAALAALKSADPLNAVPTKMPRLPTFFSAAAFRRPLLKDGRALPLTAVEHIGSMLAISKLQERYSGIDIIKEICTPDSLAEFAWDLFEAWLMAGAPAKENWAFDALGLLGDNGTVHRLVPKIREWPGESAHARAVAGLDILSAIGSDLALMSLNAIANKVKFKGLQEKAREKIAAIAEARGLSSEELADRLVPDLGLDASSALTLDFGPRQFTVAFDETLKPCVRDAQGLPLKDLPKPTRSDDGEKSATACERYKTLKKDAKAIASTQVTRLELAMVGQRRWSKADFELFFLNHPVMRFLAARLVWGVYPDGICVDAFRIAEDWTLADKGDSPYVLPETASVGIAHVLTMPAETRDAFGQIFADYEILQPFRQLGRETYTLTADEQLSNKIVRFAQKTVPTGSVLGLINRGWKRGDALDGGWVSDFIKPLGAGHYAVARLDPGTVVGELSFEPAQRITEISLHAASNTAWNWGEPLPLSSFDPVMASELLRDIDLLPPYQK